MAGWSVQNISEPSVLAVSIAEQKVHMRIIGRDDQDDLIEDSIREAQSWIAEQTGHCSTNAQYRLILDRFPFYYANRLYLFDPRQASIRIPFFPLVSVDSFTYKNFEGATVPYTNYQISSKIPPLLMPPRITSWPIADARGVNTVDITFTAGYGSAANVPRLYKRIIKTLAAEFYEHREVTSDREMIKLPYGVQEGLKKLKKFGFA